MYRLRGPIPREAVTMGQKELAEKVRDLKGLKQMAEELAAEIASIEDDIKAEMTARGVSEMLVDVFKVR